MQRGDVEPVGLSRRATSGASTIMTDVPPAAGLAEGSCVRRRAGWDAGVCQGQSAAAVGRRARNGTWSRPTAEKEPSVHGVD